MTTKKVLNLDPAKGFYSLAEAVELTATAYAPPTRKPTYARLSDGTVMLVGGHVTPHEAMLRTHTFVLHELIDAGKISPRSLLSGADVSIMGIKLCPESKEDAERYALTSEDFSKFCAAVSITTTEAAPLAPIDAVLDAGETVDEGAPAGAEQGDIGPADLDNELAELFDPVRVEQLEAMFPDSGKWAGHAERAKRNGLQVAKVKPAQFNPYRAARWWLDSKGPTGWKWERCLRVLAKNLPTRSRDSKHLLTGDYDDE